MKALADHVRHLVAGLDDELTTVGEYLNIRKAFDTMSLCGKGKVKKIRVRRNGGARRVAQTKAAE